MKNNENTKKKVKIKKRFKRAIGCMIKIRMNNLPSLPPIIFKKKSIREKNRTIIKINIFKKRKKAIFSKKNKHSRIFNIKTVA
jgi:hypothetical protein